MNLDQLKSFLTVADLGHFTRAAEQLHLAQPSLSRQIATLESELGSQLFHRARGNITLTPAGEALVPLASRMLADADRIRHQMQELAGLRAGRVRLGAPPSMCISLVAMVLGEFHRRYPGIELHLSEAGSRLLLEQLSAGQLDLALVVASEHEPAAFESLDDIPLLSEELMVIAAKAGQLPAAQGPLSLAQLAPVPQIVFSPSYDLRAATMQAYRSCNLEPNVVLEGGEMDAVLRFVQLGLGVAVVPATVLLDRSEFHTRRLEQPSLTRTISLAHRKDVGLTRAAAAMQQMITATAAQLAGRSPAINALAAPGAQR
ncbi:LysR family transcriptional regulator [Glutamicibacter creatinolyticus]|uniref:LysR family transcriptional regulator n=1 Tax=Glutamicibacter creatinolyticus TaxID=162496 RepID=UPI00321741FA